jgi:hypothetical protein
MITALEIQKSMRCYIHLRTLFLYSRYDSPNIFSIFRSSPGIMKKPINQTKITGNARVTRVPDNIATPKRIEAIPRYIGLRLIRNGPEVTSDVGSSDGCRVVAFFSNNERLQKAMTKPKPMMRNPKYVKGGERNARTGNMKFSSTDRMSRMRK